MKYLFNIFTRLRDKFRHMIIQTLKSVIESQLQYFYFEITFSTTDNKNRYLLPLIGHLVDINEAIELQQNLIEAIGERDFNIVSVKEPVLLLTHELARKKQTILSTQAIHGSEAIKVIFTRLELVGQTYTFLDDTSMEFKVNTIKTGKLPFESIKDLFVFRVDKSILEDDNNHFSN